MRQNLLLSLMVCLALSVTAATCPTANAGIDKSSVEAGRVLIKGKIDTSHDLVVRIDRGEKSTEWGTGGRDGRFEVVIEASDKIRLDGGKTGHGFVVTTTQGTSEDVNYVHCAGDLAGTFAIRREADFVTKDGVLTFADVTLKDGKELPVSLRLALSRSAASARADDAEVAREPARADDAKDSAALPAQEKKAGAIFRVPDSYTLDVALSADGKLLARGGADNIVDVWEVASGKKLHTLKGHTVPILKVAFSPDGKTLASITGSWLPNDVLGEVKLWDVATGKGRVSLKGHPDRGSCLAFATDGKTLASAAGAVKLWDVETGHEKMEIRVGASSLAFSPDGKTLATGTGGGPMDPTHSSVILWDVTTGKEKATLSGHASSITSMGFTPDGKTLASVSCTAGIDNDKDTGKLPLGALKLWDVATAKERASSAIPVLPGFHFFALAFTADSQTLISAMWSVRETENEIGLDLDLWEVATGKKRAGFWAPSKSSIIGAGSNNAEVYFAALSADGTTVAWGGTEEQDKKITGTAYVWDVQSLATSPPKLPGQ